MVATENVVEVEIDGPRNQSLYFGPLNRRIRGRFDFNRVAEPLAKMLTNAHPEPIPGQRLRLDFDKGEAALVESLREPENAVIRERLEKGGHGQAPQHETFEGIDTVTWWYWFCRVIESGIARIVKGKLPETMEGEPRKNFFSAPQQQSPLSKLASAIEKQNAVQEQSNAMLLKILDRVTSK